MHFTFLGNSSWFLLTIGTLNWYIYFLAFVGIIPEHYWPFKQFWLVLNSRIVSQIDVTLQQYQTRHSYHMFSRCDCPLLAQHSTDRTVGELCADFPVNDFCKLVCFMDMARNQNILWAPESERCPLKIHISIQCVRHNSCNPIYLTGVSNPPPLRRYICPSYAHARAEVIVYATLHPSGNRSLYCTTPCILSANGKR